MSLDDLITILFILLLVVGFTLGICKIVAWYGDLEKTKGKISKFRWPERPLGHDAKAWENGIEMVKALTFMGPIESWRDHTEIGPCHIPYSYRISGVIVVFQPHWSYFTVDGLELDVPHSARDVRRAISLVKGLRAIGYRK